MRDKNLVERDLKEALQDLEEAKSFTVKAEMARSSLEHYKDTKDSEGVNFKMRVQHLEEERLSMIAEMEAVRMKHERDRTKLRFFKGEYTGFEVSRKAFEENTGRLHKQVVDRDRVINDQKDTISRLEE